MIKTVSIGLFICVMLYAAWLVNDAPWGVKLVPPDAIMPDGSRFYGDSLNGFWHGEGEWVGADGSRYKGHFANGLFEGQGQLWFYDGGFYIGEFKKGMMHGKGELESETAGHYKGDFEENLMHGQGVLTFANGAAYSGRFVKNKFSSGEFKDGFENTYVGEMENWLFHGKGVYTTADEDRYEGSFHEGSFDGDGVALLADGSRYEGDFVAWMYSGEGTLHTAEGDIYEGSFEYGDYHGQGKLTLSEPTDEVSELEGVWRYGYLEGDPRYERPDFSQQIEGLLYTQGQLIESALDNVKASVSGDIDVFFIGVAGYGGQDVFLKEMNTVERRLASENIAQGRTLTLINHFDTTAGKPLATLTALSEVFRALPTKMNVDEDILFLYMTSHGSQDHQFSIQLDGIKLPDISSENLAAALTQSKVRYKVVIISACYSGGFIDDLEDPNTLIITAAKADRKSFGCGDDSEMTYFGDAFFEQALPQARGFIEAFDLAKSIVAERESKDFPDSERSEPQISIGENVRKQLLAWKTQRNPADEQ